MLKKTMNKLDYAQVAARGKTVRVRSVIVDGRKITVTCVRAFDSLLHPTAPLDNIEVHFVCIGRGKAHGD